ncbi:MAG: hypothetical protein LBK99_18465 [Opitutaceae bacterium]|nr:hypothetical protein [Opitutaceae bacterium]
MSVASPLRSGTGILPVDGAKRRLPASLPSLWSGAGETPAPLRTPEHGRDARSGRGGTGETGREAGRRRFAPSTGWKPVPRRSGEATLTGWRACATPDAGETPAPLPLLSMSSF